jgi:hypothetical protein
MTPTEIEAAIARVKTRRDAMEVDGIKPFDPALGRLSSLEAPLDEDRNLAESKVIVATVAVEKAKAQVAAKDLAGEVALDTALRLLAASQKNLVEKEALVEQNKKAIIKETEQRRRFVSLNHDVERAVNKECCIDCTILYDDKGMIVGATHYRMPIEDQTGGTPPVVLPGLRSRIRAGTDTVGADGKVASR